MHAVMKEVVEKIQRLMALGSRWKLIDFVLEAARVETMLCTKS